MNSSVSPRRSPAPDSGVPVGPAESAIPFPDYAARFAVLLDFGRMTRAALQDRYRRSTVARASYPGFAPRVVAEAVRTDLSPEVAAVLMPDLARRPLEGYLIEPSDQSDPAVLREAVSGLVAHLVERSGARGVVLSSLAATGVSGHPALRECRPFPGIVLKSFYLAPR